MPCRPEHARALRLNASAVRRRGGRCRGAERAGRRPTAGLAAQAGRGCASPKLLLAGASASTAGAARCARRLGALARVAQQGQRSKRAA